MQSVLTALQGKIHDLKNLKQEFEQTKVYKLHKYIQPSKLVHKNL